MQFAIEDAEAASEIGFRPQRPKEDVRVRPLNARHLFLAVEYFSFLKFQFYKSSFRGKEIWQAFVYSQIISLSIAQMLCLFFARTLTNKIITIEIETSLQYAQILRIVKYIMAAFITVAAFMPSYFLHFSLIISNLFYLRNLGRFGKSGTRVFRSFFLICISIIFINDQIL